MYQCYQLARYALNASYEGLNSADIEQLKRHLLDSIGSMIYASRCATPLKVIDYLREVDKHGSFKTPFAGALNFPNAAQLYTSLIRYPDFMDSFLAKEASCHPSDNIGALMATAQITKSSGRDFITAMAISYQVECKLCEEFPVTKKGFDHAGLLAFSITAGISRLMKLTEEQTASALGMAGNTFNPTVTSRASYTHEWQGLVSSMVANGCATLTLLAKKDIAGPVALFEGPRGHNAVYHMNLKTVWEKEKFDLIRKCCLKSYNAEVHAQSTIEGILRLRKDYQFSIADIRKIQVDTFLTAYHIVGGGEYGNRGEVFSKEQAVHSLPYAVAVALLDWQVLPPQFTTDRINRSDVQELMQKVKVGTGFPLHKPKEIVSLLDPYTRQYPDKVPALITVHLNGGMRYHQKQDDFKGFLTNPFTWTDAEEKFDLLTKDILAPDVSEEIKEIIHDLENKEFGDLIAALKKI